MAAPAEKLATQTAMAVVRCPASANMLRIRESVDGASVAAATPSKPRAAISCSEVAEKAVSTDTPPNAAAPIMSSFRRPMRSPSVPIVISEPASRNP
jgi:hypothetical protein